LAALATVGAAQAQSSVSVYGILDINAQSVNVKSAQAQSFGLGNESSVATSRLGFRGTEDLGGGNAVSFNLEGCLNPNTAGTMGVKNGSDAAPKLFNREANVELRNASFGALRLGTTDVTDAGNIEVLTSRIGNSGFNSITDIDTDKSQTISYRSPVFSGFRFQVGHANSGQTTTATSNISTGAVTSMFAAYEKGAFGAYIGSATQKGVASNQDVKQTHYGLRYNAGFADFGAYYGTAKGVKVDTSTVSGRVVLSANDPTASGTDDKFTMQRFTVSVPVKALGQGVSLGGLYGKDEANLAAQNAGDSTIYQGGISKAFSKRTVGYVSYRVQNYKNANTFDLRTSTVGVVHSF